MCAWVWTHMYVSVHECMYACTCMCKGILLGKQDPLACASMKSTSDVHVSISKQESGLVIG